MRVAEQVCAEHALTREPWSAESRCHGRVQGPSGNDEGERVSSPPVPLGTGGLSLPAAGHRPFPQGPRQAACGWGDSCGL